MDSCLLPDSAPTSIRAPLRLRAIAQPPHNRSVGNACGRKRRSALDADAIDGMVASASASSEQPVEPWRIRADDGDPRRIPGVAAIVLWGPCRPKRGCLKYAVKAAQIGRTALVPLSGCCPISDALILAVWSSVG